ncbi:hypothetical protein Q4S25_12315, partial [Morganella morganii]
MTKTVQDAVHIQLLTCIAQQTGAPRKVCGIQLVNTLHEPSSTTPQWQAKSPNLAAGNMLPPYLHHEDNLRKNYPLSDITILSQTLLAPVLSVPGSLV